MFLKEGLGRLQVLLDDELAHVRLGPEEGERASDLRVRVKFLLRLLIGRRAISPDHDLLQLDEVCHKAVLVDASVQEPSTAPIGAASGDQD